MLAFENEQFQSRPLSNYSIDTYSRFDQRTQYRERLVQVATCNSATFIKFPSHYRSNSSFRPLCPSRNSISSTPVSSLNTESPPLSKSSGSEQNEVKREPNKVRLNPILNNPLLNHRKEPARSTISSARRPIFPNELTRKPNQSSSESLATISRPKTAPTCIEHKINQSDRKLVENEENIAENDSASIDDHKHDFITRWLQEVRAATCSQQQSTATSKRNKRKILQT